MEKRGPALYWRLFSSTFLLSAFTFGGGYVIVPLMKQRFVDNLGWLEEQEMLDSSMFRGISPLPMLLVMKEISSWSLDAPPSARN